MAQREQVLVGENATGGTTHPYSETRAQKLFDAAIEACTTFHKHAHKPTEGSRSKTVPLLVDVASALLNIRAYVFERQDSPRRNDSVGLAVIDIVIANYDYLQAMAGQRSTYRKIKRQMYDLTWTLRDLVESSGWAAYGLVIADWGRYRPLSKSTRPHDSDRTAQFVARGISVADIAAHVSLQARVAFERGLPMESWESYAFSSHDEDVVARLGTDPRLREICLRQRPEWLTLKVDLQQRLLVTLGVYENSSPAVIETGASLILNWAGTVGELLGASRAINK